MQCRIKERAIIRIVAIIMSIPTNLLILLCIFILATVILAYISRASLFHPHAHGFYRFFAWEVILAMFLLNITGWFKNPLTWYQVISWVLLIISIYLVVHSISLLRKIGQPDEARQDAPMIAFEKTTRLVVIGAYKYIRHPLYSSLLFLAWGIFFKSPSWVDGLLALAATGFLIATAKTEETENIGFFGNEYRGYIGKTKMFIPFVL
jgi:protein-S-isoprenylcysteine O-methyltransferase Ste14